MPKRSTKLSKGEIDKLFYQLCMAISGTKTPHEAAEFLRDLISYQEAEMIAKRLKIAELLLENNTYYEIRDQLGVGYGTVARVQEWLVSSGEGYRKAVMKSKKVSRGYTEHEISTSNLSQIKRRYPMYYWPEIVLENVIKGMDVREKKRLAAVIKEMDKMKGKTQLYKKLKKLGF